MGLSASILLLALVANGPETPPEALTAWGLAGPPALWCNQPIYRGATDVICTLDAAPTPELIAQLAALPRATSLTLDVGRDPTSPVAPMDLRPLASLAELRSLAIRSQGSARSVVQLPPLGALSLLSLDTVAVSGLAKTTDALTALTLIDTSGFPTLTALATATALESLTLVHFQGMDAEQLSAILAAANPGLTALTVNGPGLPSLAPIGRFRGLRSLHVSSIDLEPGADFRALDGLKLTDLDLSMTPFKDLGLLSSSKDTLETLELASTALRSLAPLARFTRLRDLDLQNSPADYGRVPLSPLRRVTSLKKLSFTVDHWSRCRATPEEDLDGVRPADCDTLRELEKRGVTIEYFGGC
ncbi:MAG: hypothetical protein IV100_05945 [Myxococcales bacterium]|nr:hypothetical protein [Myxococcales bacterium]